MDHHLLLQARANKLSHLRGCEGLTMLGSLEVSDNEIHSLEELKPCQGLRLLQVRCVYRLAPWNPLAPLAHDSTLD